MKIKSWLGVCRSMFTLNNAVKGLNLKWKSVVARMRRVSLNIVVYLIWEQRNRRVFENTCSLVDSLFQKFQVILYMILYFHESNHLIINVGWLHWWLTWGIFLWDVALPSVCGCLWCFIYIASYFFIDGASLEGLYRYAWWLLWLLELWLCW